MCSFNWCIVDNCMALLIINVEAMSTCTVQFTLHLFLVLLTNCGYLLVIHPLLSLSQVCRLFNQVIIAMASHGYLSLEGGQLMVEFIVRQCSFNPDDKALAKLASEEVSPVALRDMSSKSLQLITTTIENMDQVCVCVCVCGRGCVYGWPSVCV